MSVRKLQRKHTKDALFLSCFSNQYINVTLCMHICNSLLFSTQIISKLVYCKLHNLNYNISSGVQI